MSRHDDQAPSSPFNPATDPAGLHVGRFGPGSARPLPRLAPGELLALELDCGSELLTELGYHGTRLLVGAYGSPGEGLILTDADGSERGHDAAWLELLTFRLDRDHALLFDAAEQAVHIGQRVTVLAKLIR